MKRFVLACFMTVAACGKNSASSGDAAVASAHLEARSPELDALWSAASSGDADDLARLADREGAAGLAEEADTDPAKKRIAIRALAFADGFAGLPFLSAMADAADADAALAAVETIDAIAARPRRAVDPEDAIEFRAGCAELLTIAKNGAKSRPIRVGVIRALRMWSDRACAPPEEIPIDLDTK